MSVTTSTTSPASKQAFENYLFFNPFPDAGLFAPQEYLEGKNEFDIYIKNKAQRTDGKAKTYIKASHNPTARGGLSGYKANTILYICGHGDKDSDHLVGQVDYPTEPDHKFKNNSKFYPSHELKKNTHRYVLAAGDLIDVLQWENVDKDIREIRFWACKGALSRFAKSFAMLAKEDYYKLAKITAYDCEVSLGTDRKQAVVYIGSNASRRLNDHLVEL